MCQLFQFVKIFIGKTHMKMWSDKTSSDINMKYLQRDLVKLKKINMGNSLLETLRTECS